MRVHPLPGIALTLAGVVLLTTDPLARPRYSPWSTPINIGPPINSSFAETGATLSKHGLSLYFSSNRPCDEGDAVLDFNLWVARRSSTKAPWGEPECLLINADAREPGDVPYQDREPELSRDQHWLFFASDRPGSLGPRVPMGGDIWVSWRPNIFDDQGWSEPVNLATLNTAAGERTPQFFENDEGGLPQLFFSSTRSGFFDIWVVDLVDGLAVGPAQRVENVNTDNLLEAGGSITHDGLEMFLFRGLPAVGGIPLDIYSATRSHVLAPWSAPASLGLVVNNPSVNDQEPKISPDRTMLFFASARPGSVPAPNGQPSLDIWVSTRTLGGRPQIRIGPLPATASAAAEVDPHP
jgi:hypothetical protein